MANFIVGIISLSISVVVLANLFIFVVKNTSTCHPGTLGQVCNGTAGYGTSWSAAEITMWGLLSLLGIVGMVFGVMQVFGIA